MKGLEEARLSRKTRRALKSKAVVSLFRRFVVECSPYDY